MLDESRIGDDHARAIVEPTIDSLGQEALRIMVLLNAAAVDSLTGDQMLHALVDIHDTLSRAGDDRFPFVDYATEEDLMYSDEDADVDAYSLPSTDPQHLFTRAGTLAIRPDDGLAPGVEREGHASGAVLGLEPQLLHIGMA
jgi:hypothetical protein